MTGLVDLLFVLLSLVVDGFFCRQNLAWWPQVTRPPALYEHYHLLVLVDLYERDGLESLPVHAKIDGVLPVCHPICRS